MKTEWLAPWKYCVAFVLTVVGLSASASVISVSNSSFESPAQSPGGNSLTIDGWSHLGAVNGAGVLYPSGTPLATDGNQTAFINVGPAGGENGFYQVVLSNLEPDTLYTLTFDAGNRADIPSIVGDDALGTVRGFFTLGAATPSFANAVGTPFTLTLASIADGTFTSDMIATFDTTGFGGSLNQALNIAFTLNRSAGGSLTTQLNIDDVRLTAIPEPCAPLLLLPFAPLLWLMRRLRGAA